MKYVSSLTILYALCKSEKTDLRVQTNRKHVLEHVRMFSASSVSPMNIWVFHFNDSDFSYLQPGHRASMHRVLCNDR